MKIWEYLEDDVLDTVSLGSDFGITEDNEVIPCNSALNCKKCKFYINDVEDCDINAKYEYLYSDIGTEEE